MLVEAHDVRVGDRLPTIDGVVSAVRVLDDRVELHWVDPGGTVITVVPVREWVEVSR